MPVTHADVKKDAKCGSPYLLISRLRRICYEVVPAAFNSPLGPLAPGCNRFIPYIMPADGADYDFFLSIDAYDYPDRDFDASAKMIGMALHDLLEPPNGIGQHILEFAVMPNPGKFGWYSTIDYTPPDVDMSMEAAIGRARMALDPGQSSGNRPDTGGNSMKQFVLGFGFGAVFAMVSTAVIGRNLANIAVGLCTIADEIERRWFTEDPLEYE